MSTLVLEIPNRKTFTLTYTLTTTDTSVSIDVTKLTIDHIDTGGRSCVFGWGACETEWTSHDDVSGYPLPGDPQGSGYSPPASEEFDYSDKTRTWTRGKTNSVYHLNLFVYFPSSSLPSDIPKFSTVSVEIPILAKLQYSIQYDANSGIGAPSNQTKWYNEDITISAAKPTKSGYTFKGWATSSANAAAGTVTYYGGETYSSNAALNLYAVWELTYALPMITNLTVERCNSSGTLDDEGTYALVSFSWSVFQSALARYYGGNTYPYSSNSAACSITVGSVTVTPALSGSSGAETIKVGSGSFSVDTQYSASVTITDTQSIVSPHSQTVSGALPTSSFPMDINSDGSAVAFLRPAPDNGSGVYVGGDVDINSGKHYKINGTNLGASDVGAVPTGRTVNGKALSSNITLTASDVGAEPTLTNISESGGVYSGGIEDDKLLATATINKWKTILGIS